jgi:AcrR family transcriptional regulator
MAATMTRRQRLHAATRDEIKAIARRHIAEQGAASLSLRAIARELGVTPPALYRYFDGRDALLTALLIDAYGSLAGTLEAAVLAREPGEHAGRLVGLALAYRDWALAHPHDYALIFTTAVAGYREPEAPIAEAAGRSLGLFVASIEAARQAGRLRAPAEYEGASPSLRQQFDAAGAWHGYPPLALCLAIVLWTRLHGLVSLEIFQHLQPIIGDPERLYREEVSATFARLGLAEAQPTQHDTSSAIGSGSS